MATVGNFQWLIQLARAHMSCNKPSSIERFQLWVDGVGGFLVCRSPQVRIGQAVAGAEVEIPLLADVSRHHATISRDSEGYVIEPARSVQLSGRDLKAPCALADGDVFALGGVKLKFRRPHPLSSTGRLEFVSRHQTQPSSNAVLLMSETCILGPRQTAHVVCRNWPSEAVLYQRGPELYLRADSKKRGGQPLVTRLVPGQPVTGDYFSVTIEEF